MKIIMSSALIRRLEKVECKINGSDEVFIWVNLVNDDGTIDNCDKRREDCPQIPCPKPTSCWIKQKYPNMKTIEISNESEGGLSVG